MKNKFLITTVLIAGLMLVNLSANQVYSQTSQNKPVKEQTEKFKINANCDLCKTRIEKAAISVVGVSKAIWNKDTKMMELTFNPSKTNVDKVQVDWLNEKEADKHVPNAFHGTNSVATV
jgi:hypothetical protein